MNNNKDKKNEKVAIYIDGSNFYKYLKDEEIHYEKGELFNYTKFVKFLLRGRKEVLKNYYVGIVRNVDRSRKSKAMVSGQQKFLSCIEKEFFNIVRGRVMYDSGKIREKGTDVKIAVDIVVDAFEDKYDTAILISSDTDLIPAVKYVREKKQKKLEYVGFSHAPSFGLQKNANLSILLLPEDIRKFILKPKLV